MEGGGCRTAASLLETAGLRGVTEGGRVLAADSRREAGREEDTELVEDEARGVTPGFARAGVDVPDGVIVEEVSRDRDGRGEGAGEDEDAALGLPVSGLRAVVAEGVVGIAAWDEDDIGRVCPSSWLHQLNHTVSIQTVQVCTLGGAGTANTSVPGPAASWRSSTSLPIGSSSRT